MSIISTRIWGPLSALGLAFAALAFGFDQTVKWWLLSVVGMEQRLDIPLTPFFNLKMAWNHGISYGLLTTHAQALLVVVSLLITGLLWIWMARLNRVLPVASLGLVTGGALSNALDRVMHGAVADFFYFHLNGLDFAPLDFIFNPADVAIVAGVALLLYDSMFE